ncbi:MAG: VOC family protein [Ectothiorhodospiraceae bacterium]|nr:VOC family protein [Ectothiorhodospiraceae bacterium]MCH8506538.1 VOC family protein [Ectothiorhodospiraceae bacterium]
MVELKQVRSVLAVKDLPRSTGFYRDRLGFEVELEMDGWCFLSRGDFRLMLGHCPDEMPASETNDHSYFAYVGVSDADALHREFSQRGVTELSAPESKPWGMREFLVTTPDGHRIMFGQDLDATR